MSIVCEHYEVGRSINAVASQIKLSCLFWVYINVYTVWIGFRDMAIQ